MVAVIGLVIGCVSLVLTGILGFYAIYLAKKGNQYAEEAKKLGEQAVNLGKQANKIPKQIEQERKENEEWWIFHKYIGLLTELKTAEPGVELKLATHELKQSLTQIEYLWQLLSTSHQKWQKQNLENIIKWVQINKNLLKRPKGKELALLYVKVLEMLQEIAQHPNTKDRINTWFNMQNLNIKTIWHI